MMTDECIVKLVEQGFCVVWGSCCVYHQEGGKFAVCIDEVADGELKSIQRKFDEVSKAVEEFLEISLQS